MSNREKLGSKEFYKLLIRFIYRLPKTILCGAIIFGFSFFTYKIPFIQGT